MKIPNPNPQMTKQVEDSLKAGLQISLDHDVVEAKFQFMLITLRQEWIDASTKPLVKKSE